MLRSLNIVPITTYFLINPYTIFAGEIHKLPDVSDCTLYDKLRAGMVLGCQMAKGSTTMFLQVC